MLLALDRPRNLLNGLFTSSNEAFPITPSTISCQLLSVVIIAMSNVQQNALSHSTTATFSSLYDPKARMLSDYQAADSAYTSR